ncbi:type II toxin-antitoxin system YafQ family toxin [uncultured Limosilactobacillus sp.]|uniref:type II toxin-antitoxin system RelE/ParE family toxin n=1 Tax=uncultured Limosilactobacillus sp. TaxID=2837629 RepID=UPI0025E6A55A|nr:type II toxin-antitoxin system YafQ family toxin [uncultured Limosilactobacillus sp.]
MIINRTSEFKRDYKRLKRKHYDMDKLKHVITLIVNGATDELIHKHKDHQLKGKYKSLRELHVDRSYNDNWIMVYQIRNNEIDLHILDLLKTGDHDHILR